MKSKYLIKISGNNINRIIKRLIKNKINIYNLTKINRNEIEIIIDQDDYRKTYELKGTYNINIIKYLGYISIKKAFKKNIIIYISILISLIIIFFISNFIFKIKIYHTNTELKKELLNDLKNYGISIGKYKKSYNEIQTIKQKLLEKYKTRLEWLEITRNGTIYEIRLEERIINDETSKNTPQNIIARKGGIIKKIYATNGVIVKNENEYVSKGDVIISGEIYLNEKLMGIIKANGKVYAETWYTVKVNYPLYYREEKTTKKSKNVLNISFLEKDYNILNIKKYKNYKKQDNILYQNKIIPLKVSIQNQKETLVKENLYSVEIAETKGIEYATDKIKSKLKEGEYIIDKKVLKNEQKNSTIYMEIFFKICEDITSVKEINPPEEEIYDKRFNN